MYIFDLNKEDLISLITDRDNFEQSLVETRGVLLYEAKRNNIDINFNKLFENKELNIDVFLNIYVFLNEAFDTLDENSILTLSSLVSWGNHSESYGDVKILEKVLGYCKDNNLAPLSLNEVKVYEGFGASKKYGKNEGVEYINPFILEKQHEIQENKDEYDVNEFDITNVEEVNEVKEKSLVGKINDLIIKSTKEKLKTPYKYNADIYNSIHSALYDKELNKDDLDIQKYPITLGVLDTNTLERLKGDIKSPTFLTLDFLINLSSLDENEIKTLYLMLSSDEAVVLLRNEKIIKDAGEKIAEIVIYNELKKIEEDFLSNLNRLFDENIGLNHLQFEVVKEQFKSIIKNKGLQLISGTGIEALNGFISSMGKVDDVMELIPKLIEIAQSKIVEINESKEMIDWKKSLSEYCSLNVRKQILSAIDVPVLNKTDLHFVKEQVSLTENRSVAILEQNLSGITLGISQVLRNTAPYSNMKSIFNNDKTLLLKDLFIESIKKPVFRYDYENYSLTRGMLLKYDNPEEILLNQEPINSSFKYLTIQEANDLNYHRRLYIPKKSGTSYVLEKEHEKMKNLLLEDWQDIFKMQKDNIVNEENSIRSKIDRLSYKFNMKELIDGDIAEIIVREYLSTKNSNITHNTNVIKHFDVNKMKNIKNINILYNNSFFIDYLNNPEKSEIDIQKEIFEYKDNEDKANLVEIWDKIKLGEVFNLDMSKYNIDIDDKNSNELLISMNILVEKYEKSGEKHKLMFVLSLANILLENLISYEAREYSEVENIRDECLKLAVSLAKYGIKEIDEENPILEVIESSRAYKKVLELMKEEDYQPKDQNELYLFYIKEKISDIAISSMIENNSLSSNKIIQSLLKQETNLSDNINHIFLDKNIIKKITKQLLSDLSPEMTWEIMNYFSLEFLGSNNWNKKYTLKKSYQEYFGDNFKTLTMYGEDFENVMSEKETIFNKNDFRLLSVIKETDSFLNVVKKIDATINKSLSPKERILLRIKEAENIVLDDKSYQFLGSSGILGQLNLTLEEKKEIINASKALKEKYAILEEQYKGVVHVNYPYEEVFLLFKDCFETAKMVHAEVTDILLGLGWYETDLHNMSFTSLREKNYDLITKDKKKKEDLDIIVDKVFKKHYTKEKLLKNSFLIEPLNSSPFKFGFNIFNDKTSSHEYFRINFFLPYLMKAYTNADKNTLLVLQDFEENNEQLNFEKFKFDNLIKNKKEINENAAFILNMHQSEKACLSDYFYDNLEIDNIIEYGVLTANSNIIKNLIRLSNQNDLNQIFQQEQNHKDQGLKLKEKQMQLLIKWGEKLTPEQVANLIDKANEQIEKENKIRDKRNQTVNQKENILEGMEEKVVCLDGMFKLILNQSMQSNLKNEMILILMKYNTKYIAERSKRIYSHSIFEETMKKSLGISVENQKFPEIISNEIETLLFSYFRKEAIPIDVKLNWMNNLNIDQVLGEVLQDEKKFNTFIKVFELSSSEQCFMSESELNSLIVKYNEFKEIGGSTYILSHLILNKVIIDNLGTIGLKNEKNDISRDSVKAYGQLLFSEHIDFKELLVTLNQLDKKVSHKNKRLIASLIYNLIGNIAEKDFCLDKNDHNLILVEDEVKEFNEDFSLVVANTINEKIANRISQLDKAGVSLLPYESLSAIDMDKISSYGEYMRKMESQPLLKSLFDIFKYVKVEVRNDLCGIKELLIRKMENGSLNDLVCLSNIIDNSAIIKDNYRLMGLRKNLSDILKIDFSHQEENQYDRLVDLSSKIKNYDIYQDLQAFSRMKILSEKMNDVKESGITKKKKKL